jgi:hypothetical protein
LSRHSILDAVWGNRRGTGKNTVDAFVRLLRNAIVYDPSSKRVFAMNGRSKTSSAINPVDNKVVGTVALGGGPEFSVADGQGPGATPLTRMPFGPNCFASDLTKFMVAAFVSA